MSYIPNRQFLIEVAKGNVPGHSIVNKFGRNGSVPNGSLAPVAIGGVYQTPTALTSLEMVSDDANDTSTGTGARKVRVYGLSTGYTETSEDVTMNGLTAVALTTQFYRVYRIKVIESGTYATATSASQKGTLTLRVASAGATWGIVDEADTGFGVGQSQIGAYTVQTGYTGYLLDKRISVDSGKSARAYFWTRENIDTITAPYTAMNLKEQQDGVSGFIHVNPEAPLLVIPEKTDCGFMAYGDGAVASVSVDFQILLIDNNYLP